MGPRVVSIAVVHRFVCALWATEIFPETSGLSKFVNDGVTMPDNQLSLFNDLQPSPSETCAVAVPDLQLPEADATAVKAASAVNRLKARLRKSPSKRRHKLTATTAARPRGSKASVELLNVEEVARSCTVSRATIWRWVKSDFGFPQPLRMAPGTTRWRRKDVEAWLSARSVVPPQGAL